MKPHFPSSDRPVVSIILPVRNAARTLPAALRSAQEQTLAEWELIVIDDGSTDASAEVVRAACKRDGRIRLLHSFGRGAAAARNLGLSLVRARLVAFLNPDDQWMPDKLARHVALLQAEPEIGVAFDRARVVDALGQSTLSTAMPVAVNLKSSDLLCEAPLASISSLVVRRSVFDTVGDFDEQMRFADDLEFVIRVRCLSTWHVQALDEPLTRHTLNPHLRRTDLEAMFRGWQTLMNKVRIYAPDLVAVHYENAQALQWQRLAQHAARLKLPLSQGLNLLSRALRSHPVTWLRQPLLALSTLGALARSAWSRQRYVFMPPAPF